MAKTKETQLKAIRNYEKRNDRINIVFPAGTKERIRKVIEGRSYSSVAGFIKEAVLLSLDTEEKFIEFEKNT